MHELRIPGDQLEPYQAAERNRCNKRAGNPSTARQREKPCHGDQSHDDDHGSRATRRCEPCGYRHSHGQYEPQWACHPCPVSEMRPHQSITYIANLLPRQYWVTSVLEGFKDSACCAASSLALPALALATLSHTSHCSPPPGSKADLYAASEA